MALGVMCVVSKLYGLDSIFTFAFPLMMGMLSGVYTSLCVSTSAWVLWNDRKSKRLKQKSLTVFCPTGQEPTSGGTIYEMSLLRR